MLAQTGTEATITIDNEHTANIITGPGQTLEILVTHPNYWTGDLLDIRDGNPNGDTIVRADGSTPYGTAASLIIPAGWAGLEKTLYAGALNKTELNGSPIIVTKPGWPSNHPDGQRESPSACFTWRNNTVFSHPNPGNITTYLNDSVGGTEGQAVTRPFPQRHCQLHQRDQPSHATHHHARTSTSTNRALQERSGTRCRRMAHPATASLNTTTTQLIFLSFGIRRPSKGSRKFQGV